MSFRVYCDVKINGKKCNKDIEPLINKKTKEIYCECGKRLENQDCLTVFAKNNLISLGKVINSEATAKDKPFSTKCPSCGFHDTPVYNKKTDLLECSACKADLKLSDFFKKMFLEQCK